MTAAERIYTQAKRGTGYNPGLPDPLASIVVAQAKHETGNFTSRFFTENNNAFGYAYYAGSNYQTGAGDLADNRQPIATYANIEDSTKEVIDWIWRRFRRGEFPDPTAIQTTDQYAAALKSAGYYGDTLANYARGLKSFYVPIAVASGIGLLAVLAIAIYGYSDGWFR